MCVVFLVLIPRLCRTSQVDCGLVEGPTLTFQWSFFLGAFAKLRKSIISFVMSVRPPAWNNSAPTGRISMKFDI